METIMPGKAAVRNGERYPWLNEGAIDFLIDNMSDDWNVFEWGTGYSTVWWGKRVNSVVSIENKAKWPEKLKKNATDNINFKLRKLIKGVDCPYVQAINEDDFKYDCIIIDGRNRVRCMIEAVDHIKPGGFVVLDNSDRKKYKKGFGCLNGCMLKKYISPIVSGGKFTRTWETTIWEKVK